MRERGVKLQEVRIIPDEKDRIVDTVLELSRRHTYVITSGGIGKRFFSTLLYKQEQHTMILPMKV